MRFGLLGPLAVWTTDGAPVNVPDLKVRVLLADLLAHQGRPVPVDRLVDDLWGERPPANPSGALQTKVWQLRRALNDAEAGGRDLVVSRPPGYLLHAPGQTDADRFDALVERATGTPAWPARVTLLDEALALWRGPVLADFADEPFTRALATRLEEQRLVAVEERAAARLALGEHQLLVGELADLVVQHPFRERARALQLRALYRAGRQGEALASYARFRRQLADELGLDPGPELVALHRAILAHDPVLLADAPAATAVLTGRAGLRTDPNQSAGPGGAGGRRDPGGASGAGGGDGPAGPDGPRGADDSLTRSLWSAGSTNTPPPAGSGRVPPRTNLPAPLTPLVGRAEAVRHVHDLLRVERLITLVGPGGVGKTRLAVEAAHQLAEAYPDGVWLVELASLRPDDPAALAGSLLAVLGIREATGADRGPTGAPATPADRLVDVLRGRSLLLVLDNCEHVVEPVAELAQRVLPHAPGVRLLATSQDPLGVAGERVWPVPPLELPDPEVTEPEVLARSSAVQLFVARAAAAVPGFALDAANARAVAELCRRLDAVPLALELAATRVRALGVHGLVDRLDDRFRLLSGGHRGAPPRQQTLRAMIDWSWELLSDPERVVLRRLAAHADGCTVEAAEAVCADRELPAGDVLGLLVRLVDRSLVAMTEGAGEPRYRLLESVAEYCLARLREADEVAVVRRRHRRHYVELARRADEELRGSAQRRWLAQLDQETANLRLALDGALADGDAAGALELTTALAWYRYLRGRLREARRSIEAALAVPGTVPASLRAAATCWRAGLALLEAGGDHAPLVGPALAGWPPDEDPAGRARAACFLGLALLNTGDVATSQELVDDALAQFERLGDRWGVAIALSLRAGHAQSRGDLEAASRDGARSVALFRELGDRWGQLQGSFALTSRAEAVGDYPEATRLHREGLRMAEELGLWLEASDRLSGLGRIALLSGDYDRAREFHERALRLAAEQNFKPGELYAQIGLGLGARREGRLDAAEELLRGVLEWTRQPGLDADVVRALLLAELGFVAEQRGGARSAHELHAEAFDVATATGDPRAQALALEGLAGSATLDGRPADAARLLGAAAMARASVGAPLPAGERGDVDRITGAARAALGAAAFAGEFERGTALSPAEAYRSLVAGLPRPA
ncbi:BTAD domain-containing putative transcriptional regulator [Micromonospora sp. C31]|uniref:AfsR/SARP family transcriptional regulator n=1 Tax=Micromonospora sp. C31 TaxID=2824876 RepID=UPI001FFD47A1|nr:BTAD domain-containing putative transcriptional regulator [Micromonospora sp. C31]